MVRRRPWIWVVTVILASCAPETSAPQEPESPRVVEPTTSPSVAGSEETDITEGIAASRPVAFRALDGVQLAGRVFGRGDVGIVLSHMGRTGDDQSDWFPIAQALARRGYVAFTYDRRGVCPRSGLGCSKGSDDYSEHWRDVLGAARYLLGHEVHRVFLAGASIGAMATLYAVERARVPVAGMIWVAGLLHTGSYYFERKDVRAITVPSLIMSGDRDAFEAARDARTLYRWIARPKRLLLLNSPEHGTDMLDPGLSPGAGRRLRQAVLGFI